MIWRIVPIKQSNRDATNDNRGASRGDRGWRDGSRQRVVRQTQLHVDMRPAQAMVKSQKAGSPHAIDSEDGSKEIESAYERRSTSFMCVRNRTRLPDAHLHVAPTYMHVMPMTITIAPNINQTYRTSLRTPHLPACLHHRLRASHS